MNKAVEAREVMIRTFEIFTESYSEIIQATNMVMAIQTFFGKIEASPMPLIISIDDVTFREGVGKEEYHHSYCQSKYIHSPELLPCNCKSVKPDKWIDVPVCKFDYYDVRSGKCRYGSVHHGNIYCDHPNCKS